MRLKIDFHKNFDFLIELSLRFILYINYHRIGLYDFYFFCYFKLLRKLILTFEYLNKVTIYFSFFPIIHFCKEFIMILNILVNCFAIQAIFQFNKCFFIWNVNVLLLLLKCSRNIKNHKSWKLLLTLMKKMIT